MSKSRRTIADVISNGKSLDLSTKTAYAAKLIKNLQDKAVYAGIPGNPGKRPGTSSTRGGRSKGRKHRTAAIIAWDNGTVLNSEYMKPTTTSSPKRTKSK